MPRLLYPLYALFAYMIGLTSILYLVGFVADRWVPKTINAGPAAGLPQGSWTNVAILAAFLVVHSVMARPAFKRRWIRIVPAELERATYILISGLTTFALVWAWQPMPASLWDAGDGAAAIVLWTAQALGWLTIVLATFNIDHFAFFGLRQAWDRYQQRRHQPTPFTARFLYGMVRHPISLGWLLVFWSTPHMTEGHLLFACLMTVYIAVVTPIEERDLIDALGDDYTSYRKRVRAFLPWPRVRPQAGD
jgi:methanethiol S-methyltransferase